MSSTDFGAELRRMRLARQWSQEELARQAGIDQTSVSQFERGKHLPSMETVSKIAKAFRMDAEELARMAGYLAPKPTTEELIDRTPLAQLVAALETIPEFRRDRQIDQIKAFAPPAQERLVRMVARDFANRIQDEIERQDEERRREAQRDTEPSLLGGE